MPGATMMDKVRHLERHDDELRRLLMFEPRGSPAMMADLIVPPCDPTAAAGLVIMEQTEYPAMSGHNTICTATALLESNVKRAYGAHVLAPPFASFPLLFSFFPLPSL